MMRKQQPAYLAFILRVRWAKKEGQLIWRIAVERPGQPGEVQLKSLEALCAYLTAQTQLGEKGGDLPRADNQ